jgi:hypothetical protein
LFGPDGIEGASFGDVEQEHGQHTARQHGRVKNGEFDGRTRRGGTRGGVTGGGDRLFHELKPLGGS